MIDFSVIIPCYNSESYIDKCVASILAQVQVTTQIVLIDDCSTDNTWNLLEDLSEKHSNITCKRLSQNQGQANARNVGIAMSRGEYIGFLDSDDLYKDAEVLSKWLAVSKENDLDVCIAQFNRFSDDGTKHSSTKVPMISGGVGSTKDSPSIVNTQSSWQVIYRQEFAHRTNLSFSKKLRQREDRLFFIEAFTLADRIGVADLEAILYRDHSESTMKQVSFEQMAQFNTHMGIMAEIIDRAREADRIHPDFERANAAVYFTQAFRYWSTLLISGLSAGASENGSATATADSAISHEFIANLHRLTKQSAPLFRDIYFRRSSTIEALKIEGTLDIARMAIAAERNDILLKLFASERVHHSSLRELVEVSDFDWAEEAALQYQKYNRNAVFVEEPLAGIPPLSSLVKKLVLHIGLPKTGSSAVQEFFENERFPMLERGIYYPIYGAGREVGMRRNRSAGHFTAIQQILKNSENNVAERWAAEIHCLDHKVDTLVISSETIMTQLLWPSSQESALGHPNPVSAVIEALGIKDVEIVVILRRQDEWFRSFYREVMANPFNLVTETGTQFFYNLHDRGLFDYEQILDQMNASNAISKVHVNSHKNIRLSGGAVEWFLSVLGASDVEFDNDTSALVNESVSDAIAANARYLKLMRLARPTAEKLWAEVSTSERLQNSSYSLFTPEQWAEVEQKLAPFLEAYDNRFPDEKPKERRPISTEWLAVHPILLETELNYFPHKNQIGLERIAAKYKKLLRKIRKERKSVHLENLKANGVGNKIGGMLFRTRETARKLKVILKQPS